MEIGIRRCFSAFVHDRCGPHKRFFEMTDFPDQEPVGRLEAM